MDDERGWSQVTGCFMVHNWAYCLRHKWAWLLLGPLVAFARERTKVKWGCSQFLQGYWAVSSLLGLHWDFPTLYLDPKSHTKALLYMDGCQIIVTVRGYEQGISYSYSTILLTSIPYHTVMSTVSLWYNLKYDSVSPPNLSFFLNIFHLVKDNCISL